MPLRRFVRQPAPGLIACLALVAGFAVALPPALAAQSPMPPTGEKEGPVTEGQDPRGPESVWRDDTWKVGSSFGFPGARLRPIPILLTLGIHAQQFPAGLVGLEGSLGIAPVGLASGALPLGARGGVTLPLRTDALLVLPSAGVSAVGDVTSRERPIAGFYAGLATVDRAGLRLGVTFHWLNGSRQPVWLVEIGGLRL
jgi:hypothetical protein